MSDLPVPSPTERELEILKILWARGPSTVRAVYEEMRLSENLAQTTVQTFLRLMEDKGLVRHEALGRSFVYTPLYTRERTLSREFAFSVGTDGIRRFGERPIMRRAVGVATGEQAVGGDMNQRNAGVAAKRRGFTDRPRIDAHRAFDIHFAVGVVRQSRGVDDGNGAGRAKLQQFGRPLLHGNPACAAHSFVRGRITRNRDDRRSGGCAEDVPAKESRCAEQDHSGSRHATASRTRAPRRRVRNSWALAGPPPARAGWAGRCRPVRVAAPRALHPRSVLRRAQLL